MRWKRCGILASLALLQIACASDGDFVPHRDLAPVWKDFLAMPTERAMAIAGDPRRDRWVTGATGGHAERADAEAEAIRQCKIRRGVRRIQAPCVLYAINDEIVWGKR